MAGKSRWSGLSTGASLCLGLLTAGLGTSTAFLSFRTASLQSDVAILQSERDKAVGGQSVAVANSESLKADNSALEARTIELNTLSQEQAREIRALEQSLERAEAAIPAGAPPSTAPDVKYVGELTLNDATANLDATGPSWDPWDNASYSSSATGGGEVALTEDGRRLRVLAGATAAYLRDQEATYAACLDPDIATYSNAYLPVDSLAPESWLCVRTTEDRYATMRIVDRGDETLKFEVVTYQRPGD